MFQMDEVTKHIPQDDGKDIWQNGRTGEMANFAMFKVHHNRDALGRIHYQMEQAGVGVAANPFTGLVERSTFILAPPMGSRPKTSEPSANVSVWQPRPQARFKWPVAAAVFLSLAFWAGVIYWLWGMLCR
jgi:hypothetical protein